MRIAFRVSRFICAPVLFAVKDRQEWGGMLGISESFERRTTTDVVFDQLYEEIASLRLLPGTKLSEVEVARRFGVSRQPVRDAFNRLGHLELLLIRPQKATEVRGFSMRHIANARFVRLAVELEVVRHACSIWDESRDAKLQQNLLQQKMAVETEQQDMFHALDYQFHRHICELGDKLLAFDTIQECKRKVDRLCMLSLGRENESSTLLEDHQDLASALQRRSVDDATEITRQHLGRLDKTIAYIHETHSEYFE